MKSDLSPSKPPGRVESLDQFRGYTVAGMLLVNFLGGFKAVPAILKHHNTYCSYADTIMPQFFLAVGFAYRLTMLRRLDRDGKSVAYGHAVSRAMGLLLLGFVVYHLDGGVTSWDELKSLGVVGFFKVAFQREIFQTLVHIALASLWVLPVIAAGPGWRLAWLIGSAAIHVALSEWWYYDWVMTRPGIDGGPLGFLTWTIPLLAGSFAYDFLSQGNRIGLQRLCLAALAMMAIGYGLTAADGRLDAPPFFPPDGPVGIWTMSQRSGSLTYLMFSTGLGLAIYAGFVIACDVGHIRIGTFRTFGRNALVAYLLHPIVASAFKPYLPRDAPGWYVLAGFAVYFWLTYTMIRTLERQQIFLKL